jgi:hypothetical protein
LNTTEAFKANNGLLYLYTSYRLQANIGGTSYGAEKLPFVIDGVWENVKNIPLHGFVKYFIISTHNK